MPTTCQISIRGFTLSISAFLCVLISCSSKNNNAALQTFIESFEQSTRSLSHDTETEYRILTDKTTQPETSERAKIWQSKAEAILRAKKNVYSYIRELKSSLKKNSVLHENEAAALYDHVRNFKDLALRQDAGIQQEFSRKIAMVDNFLDSSSDKKDSYIYYFKQTDFVMTRLTLAQLENNISVVSRQVIMYCNDQVGSLDGSSLFTTYSAIIGQSSSIVLPGEEITITAGIGAFSKTAQPKITVGGKEVTVTDNGAAYYHFKAFAKPGKYTVPVQIEFHDENGERQTVRSEIEYTVTQLKP